MFLLALVKSYTDYSPWKWKLHLAKHSTDHHLLRHLSYWKASRNCRKQERQLLFFLYCVAGAVFPFNGRVIYRKSQTENVKQLNFNSSPMPMPLSSIASSEQKDSVAVVVYQVENGYLVAVLYSKHKSPKRLVNSLRLLSGFKTHYCFIKNFSNLLRRLTRSRKKENTVPGLSSVPTVFNLQRTDITEDKQIFVSQLLLLYFERLLPRQVLNSRIYKKPNDFRSWYTPISKPTKSAL